MATTGALSLQALTMKNFAKVFCKFQDASSLPSHLVNELFTESYITQAVEWKRIVTYFGRCGFRQSRLVLFDENIGYEEAEAICLYCKFVVEISFVRCRFLEMELKDFRKNLAGKIPRLWVLNFENCSSETLNGNTFDCILLCFNFDTLRSFLLKGSSPNGFANMKKIALTYSQRHPHPTTLHATNPVFNALWPKLGAESLSPLQCPQISQPHLEMAAGSSSRDADDDGDKTETKKVKYCADSLSGLAS